MLSLSNLSYSVSERQLLEINRLATKERELVALLGANGAGKSTLFKAITGEITCSGDIKFHNKSIQKWKPITLAKHLGVLPQASQLSFPFTGGEVVSLGLIPLTASKAEGRLLARKAMEETDTLHFFDRVYSELSGGERQRIHLARVLVQLSQAEKAPLLLLDEPTSAQDLGQQHQILNLSKTLCHERGWGVVAIIHDLNHALRYCDSVWLLQDGKVVDSGRPSDVLSVNQVDRVWGYKPDVVELDEGRTALV